MAFLDFFAVENITLDVDKVGAAGMSTRKVVVALANVLKELMPALTTQHAAAYKNESQRFQSCIILNGCWAE